MRSSSAAWLAVAVSMAVAAALAWPLERTMLDWQPGLARSQPWRAITAVAVHYSGMHLGANLVGALWVALLGWVAKVPARMVWAWLVAWPLTQWGLLIKPELLHYGGLSGVLHAGVAVVALHLMLAGQRAQRWVSAAILLGVAIKVLGEAPWGAVLQHKPGWDIAVAPIAHATGLVSGLLAAAVAHGLGRRAQRGAD
jgi:rhomboid family GlyGly-CTERM serine protease